MNTTTLLSEYQHFKKYELLTEKINTPLETL